MFLYYHAFPQNARNIFVKRFSLYNFSSLLLWDFFVVDTALGGAYAGIIGGGEYSWIFYEQIFLKMGNINISKIVPNEREYTQNTLTHVSKFIVVRFALRLQHL